MLGLGSYLTTETKAQPLMLYYIFVYYNIATVNDAVVIHYNQILGGELPLSEYRGVSTPTAPLPMPMVYISCLPFFGAHIFN